MRTYNNRIGDEIIQAIYYAESKRGSGIGRRELERSTGFPSKTVSNWLGHLRDINVIPRHPSVPIRLTKRVKDLLDKNGGYKLMLDHRKKPRRNHNTRSRIPRGKRSKTARQEYSLKKERLLVAILRAAATNRGISRQRCLMNGEIWPVLELKSSGKGSYSPAEDRKLIEYCFDYLTLSEPPILQASPNYADGFFMIYDPLLREFIILIERLLGYLLNRMQLDWSSRTQRKKPTTDEVDWIDFLYPKELRNKAFSYFHEIQSLRDKDRDRFNNITYSYDSKIRGYDHLIKKAWDEIQQTKYSHIRTKYPAVYDLITNRIYPKFLRG